GEIDLDNDFYNRFVQIELFCAYYNYMKGKLEKRIEKLNKRIKKLDPAYEGIKKTIILSAAFNAGYSKINKCIDRFLKLSDADIKKKLGKPPYDSNVLLGILANSFGQDRVGGHVLFYAVKVEAWSKLLDTPIEKQTNMDVAELVSRSEKGLDKKYARLRSAVKDSKGRFKIGYFLGSEARAVRGQDVIMPAQVEMLLPTIKEVFAKVFKKNRIKQRWSTGRKRIKMIRSCMRRRKCWKEMQREHTKWKKAEIKKGDLVQMKENDPNKPYFCQQVGKAGGTSNNPDDMYMDQDFEPILEALVELVNHQIDLFNEDPESYGYSQFKGEKIPHVDAIKISGAMRTPHYQYKVLPKSQGAATRDFSAHLFGHALDIGALKPANSRAALVRFKEAFEYNGKKRIPAGGYLRTKYKPKFGGATRAILSKMIGRAFLSMRSPLRDQGIELKPLWERSPKNWHIAIGKK
ncbi:hypothetical protein ACFLZH_06040, partial [Patescibacteria group bacterium]